MNWKFGIMLLLTGLLVVLTPRFILPTCEYQGFSKMACSDTGTAEMFIGVMIMASSGGLFFSKSRENLRWLSFSALVGGVSVVWIPEAIGYCHSGRMPCNYGTVPVLRLLGVLIILLTLAGFSLSFKGDKN